MRPVACVGAAHAHPRTRGRVVVEHLSEHWTLEPDLVYLNHGSYGACPATVLARQQELRMRMERQPMRFFQVELEPLLDGARAALGRFVHADPDDLAFLPNATTAVNTVLRSLTLAQGDELLTTDHTYAACRNALDFVAANTGARVAVATLPFPVVSPDAVVDSVLSRVSARTRFALLDHVTSPTALVLPIARLCRELAERGVMTIVDGAHAPGMLELDVERIGAAYYVGNCHKWLCAPKSAGFLHVRSELRDGVRPLTISHGATAERTERSRFHLEFDWMGTTDPTAALCVPAAIAFLEGLLPGGFPGLCARNHELACTARALLCEALDREPACPEPMLGTMAAVELPALDAEAKTGLAGPRLGQELLERFGIAVPIVAAGGGHPRLLRISAQAYNRIEHYEQLAEALRTLRA